jgi:glutaredoxin 3
LKGAFVPTVEIYSKTTCPYCWRAKHLLTSKGIDYKEIVVDFGGPDKQAMIRRAGGRTTVPQIFIGDRHIGGCDDLMALDRTGRLDELIAA